MEMLLALFLLLSTKIHASTPVQTQSQPIICPPRNSIIQYGLSSYMVQDAGGNWIGGFLAQNAGTINQWTFMFGSIPAPNRTIAMALLIKALPTIKDPVGPVHVNANQWQCTYPNLYNYLAVAVYPPLGCTQCANPA
jgi:hypothetical protein